MITRLYRNFQLWDKLPSDIPQTHSIWQPHKLAASYLESRFLSLKVTASVDLSNLISFTSQCCISFQTSYTPVWHTTRRRKSKCRLSRWMQNTPSVELALTSKVERSHQQRLWITIQLGDATVPAVKWNALAPAGNSGRTPPFTKGELSWIAESSYRVSQAGFSLIPLDKAKRSSFSNNLNRPISFGVR